jgi:hypothetical protein
MFVILSEVGARVEATNLRHVYLNSSVPKLKLGSSPPSGLNPKVATG